MQPSIVGFFDILGTSATVMSDRFSDIDILEFVNAVGLAAYSNPTVRFAVFSDSLIISTGLSDIKPLFRAVNFMYGNWYSELIYVRGAISCGDIHWVDDPPSDNLFQCHPNLIYARVYGKGLVSAHNLEKSGTGAVCFLTEKVAELFRRVEPCSVLENQKLPLLCWATKRQANTCRGFAQLYLGRTKKNTDKWKHATATKDYWDMVISQLKFLPDVYSVC